MNFLVANDEYNFVGEIFLISQRLKSNKYECITDSKMINLLHLFLFF